MDDAWVGGDRTGEKQTILAEVEGRSVLGWLLSPGGHWGEVGRLTQIVKICWNRYIRPKHGKAPYAPELSIWSLPEFKTLTET